MGHLSQVLLSISPLASWHEGVSQDILFCDPVMDRGALFMPALCALLGHSALGAGLCGRISPGCSALVCALEKE